MESACGSTAVSVSDLKKKIPQPGPNSFRQLLPKRLQEPEGGPYVGLWDISLAPLRGQEEVVLRVEMEWLPACGAEEVTMLMAS